MRIFDIVVMGAHVRTEPAGERLALELQHELATGIHKGQFVHVRERFVPDTYPVTPVVFEAPQERASKPKKVKGVVIPYSIS